MKVIVLGCATSTGVPIVGCGCGVCLSTEPRNKRTRSSIIVQARGLNILVDTSPDLRLQCLRSGITRIDAVLYTHTHADHTHGIDELRIFNFINKMTIRCYGNAYTLENLKMNFRYIFDENARYPGKPRLVLNEIEDEFEIDGVRVIPIEIDHANWTILGYRIGNMAYLTDCSGIPEESMKKLEGLELLIVGALRDSPHPAHFSVEQALEAIDRVKPKKALFTHMGHELDYHDLLAKMPEGVEPAYDGATVEMADP